MYRLLKFRGLARRSFSVGGISTPVVHVLPKDEKRVRLPYPALIL